MIYAYGALRNIGSDRAKEILMRYVRAVDRFAVAELAGFPSNATAAYLIGVSAEGFPKRDAAVGALRAMPQFSVPQLLHVLDTAERGKFDGALEVLRGIFRDRAQPAYSFVFPWEWRYRYPEEVADAAGRLHSGPFSDADVRRAAAMAWRAWWEASSKGRG
jgi:hypothetical protein